MWFLLVILFAPFGITEGKKCDTNHACEVATSICVNNTCVCPPNFVFNSEHTNCIEVSQGYGSPCQDNLQCSTRLQSGGKCDKGVCVCSDGYHYFKGECWKTSGLDEKCADDNNCFVSNDFESAVCNSDKKCVCANGYYQREYSSCRRISKKEGDPCGIALDCHYENATCTRQRTCGKKNGTEDDYLSDESKDIDENVSKKKRAIFSFGSMFASGYYKIGNNCTKNADCPKNSECYQGAVCLCKLGYYTLDNSTCLPELGSNCTEGKCPGKNTICGDNKYCVCRQGFVATPNSRLCDKMSRNIDWSCLRDEQCGFFGPGGKCESKKCHCSNDTHWVAEQLYCWVTKKFGENCVTSEDCGIKNSTMYCNSDSNKCSCPDGTHPSGKGTDCHKDSKQVGQPCIEDIDCIYEQSKCNTTSHLCSCKLGFIEHGKNCIPGINGTCKVDSDCTVADSKCINSTCTCKELTVPNDSLDKCLSVANTIGIACSVRGQCALLDGDCISGKCNCRNGSYFETESRKCFEVRRINDTCRTAYNCYMKHAQCLGGRCRCARGYRPVRNGTECRGGQETVRINLMLLFGSLFIMLGVNSFKN